MTIIYEKDIEEAHDNVNSLNLKNSYNGTITHIGEVS